MAIVLSKTGERVVYGIKRIEEGVTCDVCSGFMKANDVLTYYKVTTGHNDWGNDSCDSVEEHDICPNCINKFVVDYLKDGSQTAYIDIATTHTYPRTHWDK